MIYRDYELVLTLQGPILSQASGTLAFGLDAAMQRYRGEPVLNGAQIRGNIRHALRFFDSQTQEQACLGSHIDCWFPDEDTDFEDQRSPLNFDMFWRPLLKVENRGGVRTRITIESSSGKVKKGALAVVEDLYPAGICVPFHGLIHARFNDEDECQCFEKWLDKALQWLAAIGAQKGVGYGRLLYHELSTSQPRGLAITPSRLQEADRLCLSLTLDRPFCIGRQVSSEDNRILSSTNIPGHVIKGVLARQVAELTGKTGADLSVELDRRLAFDDLMVGHAMPVRDADDQRPRAMPLNLAWVDDRWCLFITDAPPALKKAPEFQPDWKSKRWQAAAEHLGINDDCPERYLLVRTAINPDTNAAAESQLFSMECVDPVGFLWNLEIDLSGINQARREKVTENLQMLLAQGLDQIGKTHARARARLQALPLPALPLEGRRWQVVLQTPARMLPLDFRPPGVNARETMREAYNAYWHEASGGSLELTAWFSQQCLAGGDYFHHRFRVENRRHYTTELLTEPGSVFILEAKSGRESEARDLLGRWQRRNLPGWENEQEPAHWTTTVHLPEHGYGEIQVEILAPEVGQ